jgi:PAS domain S-box-containing protein
LSSISSGNTGWRILSDLADELFGALTVDAVTEKATTLLCSRFAAEFVSATWGTGPQMLVSGRGDPARKEALRAYVESGHSRQAMGGKSFEMSFPDSAAARAAGAASAAVLRFTYDQTDYATFAVGFANDHTLSPDDVPLLEAAVRLIAHAYTSARMVERKRAALQAKSFMETASQLLAVSTDREVLLHELAKLALPRLGDYSIIELLEKDAGSPAVGVAHVVPAMEEEILAYLRRYPRLLDDPDSPSGKAVSSGEPVVGARLSDADLSKIVVNDEQLRHMERLSPSAYIVVPLKRFGSVLGIMSFCLTGNNREYSKGDVTLAVTIADRVASVLYGISLLNESIDARKAAEAAFSKLQEQAAELSAANDTLQAQAMELEQQTEEAQALTEELEITMEGLGLSELRFRALIDASAQAVWNADAHGGNWAPSVTWERLTGRKMHIVEPQDVDIVHPLDAARTDQAWKEAVQTGTPYELEHRIRVADGSYRWFLARAVPIMDSSGRVVKEWVGMHTDIHERFVAAADQQLLIDAGARAQQSSDPDQLVRELLSLLVSCLGLTHARLVEIDLERGEAVLSDAHLVVAGETLARTGGAKTERIRLSDVSTDQTTQMRGEPTVVVDTMTDPTTAAQYESVYSRMNTRSVLGVPLMRGGRWMASLSVSDSLPRHWSEREIAIVRRVGNKLWLAFEAARALRMAEAARSEAERRAIESERLTTELARTNAELAANEALVSGVVDSAMDAIISADSDGRIGVFNAAAERMFGVSAINAVGANVGQFILPSTDAEVEAGVNEPARRLQATGRAQEVTGCRADGTRFPGEATISEVASDQGRLMTVVLRDVTEQRALEAQLIHSQKMEAVGRLAGGVAHDFNNILTVIRSCADFLQESLPAGDDRRMDVDEIVAATDRASSLTRQLLTFSRKQVLLPRSLDVNAVVRGVEPMLRRLIGEEIELAVMLHETYLSVRADPGQLEQVIINLALNARDAMSKGGVLGIETETVSLSPADVQHHMLDPMTAAQPVRTGPYVTIRVSDTGTGIENSVLPHVFEPFFTTKEQGHGTGLGLATVFGIITQGGGVVRVRSRVGEGSTFEVLLPMLGEHESGEHVPVVLAERHEASGTILLAEDEVAVRRSVRRMLERAGYTVLEARHGADALLVWKEHHGKIDLLLTDLRMPELGGRELLAHLHAERPDLPAIAMSGYPPEATSDGDAAWVSGPRMEFLAKPFTTDLLLSAVGRLLQVS